MKLDLICEAAECIDPDGPIMVGSDLPQEQDKSYIKPIVAAIPLMMLVLGAGVCGVMMARILPYLKPRKKGTKGSAGESRFCFDRSTPDSRTILGRYGVTLYPCQYHV